MQISRDTARSSSTKVMESHIQQAKDAQKDGNSSKELYHLMEVSALARRQSHLSANLSKKIVPIRRRIETLTFSKLPTLNQGEQIRNDLQGLRPGSAKKSQTLLDVEKKMEISNSSREEDYLQETNLEKRFDISERGRRFFGNVVQWCKDHKHLASDQSTKSQLNSMQQKAETLVSKHTKQSRRTQLGLKLLQTAHTGSIGEIRKAAHEFTEIMQKK